MDFFVRLEFLPGTTIEESAKQAVDFAKRINANCIYTFNGYEIYACPNDDSARICNLYDFLRSK